MVLIVDGVALPDGRKIFQKSLGVPSINRLLYGFCSVLRNLFSELVEAGNEGMGRRQMWH